MRRSFPVRIKRVVVKVGTAILTRSKNYRLNKSWIKKLAAQIAALINRDIEVILVSSGAIGAGMGMLKLDKRPKLLPQQQAAAAIGQIQLMKIYDTFFKQHKLITAQILLTRDDLSNRKRYLNAKNTLLELLTCRAVPIINENDTVSADEIKFGDNDKLSALVAALVQADLLIILSDVEGLCAGKKVICEVENIDGEIEKYARGTKGKVGTGGMASKVDAAKICCASGIACIVANGKTGDILLKLLESENLGTLFLPKQQRLLARKRWIGFSARLSGQIFVDAGARQALTLGNKSLLPKGVVRLRGNFAVGDTVSILGADNREFARGLVNYSAQELDKIKGKNTDQIKPILGQKYYDEVVHRDNIVIL